MLFVGTQSNLLAYDVERNADAFFVDVQDGVNSLAIGQVGNRSDKLIVAGGNCSILGFDKEGTESFWTVTGDNVGALAFYEKTSLLVGSDDFEIRMFQGEEIVGEITEGDKITMLHTMDNGQQFIYGLANGTIGVYDNIKNRLWRVKTKHKPTVVFSYDIDLDGVQEVFTGWSNGLLTVRRSDNGTVLHREMFDSPIAAIFKIDYRMDGKEEVIVCTEAGTIVGYLPSDAEFGALFDSGIGKETAADQLAIDELHATKLQLAAELKAVEKQIAISKGQVPSVTEAPAGSLPPNTSVSYTLSVDLESHSIAVRIEANTDVQIVNVVVVDIEGVVLGTGREVLAFAPAALSRATTLPLRPTRNQPATVRVQSHIASRSLTSYLHIFEKDIQIPRFASFAVVPDTSRLTIDGNGVVFVVKEAVERFVSYLNGAFILPNKLTPIAGEERFSIGFVSVRDESSNPNSNRTSTGPDNLMISAQRFTEGGQTMTRVRVRCTSIDLAGDIIQDMADYFSWTDISTQADFPAEFQAFEDVLQTVVSCSNARTSLTADMADDSTRIKAMIIRAEDSRLMLDMAATRRAYTELSGLNNAMIGAYNIRSKNHHTLLAALKAVNQMIQRASNLRVGPSKNRLVTDSRLAVKENQMHKLIRILQKGYDATSSAGQTS